MNTLEGNVYQIVQNIDLDENVRVQEATTFLLEYLEKLPQGQDREKEVGRFTLGLGGKIRVASSVKLSNVRFHLWKLFMKGLEAGVAFPEAPGKPGKLLVLIQFLQALRELSELPMGLQEAEVLLALWKLKYEQESLTIDRLYDVVGERFSYEQTLQSLEKFVKLHAITMTTEGIEVYENIAIISET